MDLNDKITTIVKYIFMIVYTCLIIYLLRQDCNTVSFWLGTILLMDEAYSILHSNLKETKQNDVENKQEEETEMYIRMLIQYFCKENGFIENLSELQIYVPTEKDKDDLFDEVFDLKCTKTMYLTRCVKNLRTGEEITVVIPKNDIHKSTKN